MSFKEKRQKFQYLYCFMTLSSFKCDVPVWPTDVGIFNCMKCFETLNTIASD